MIAQWRTEAWRIALAVAAALAAGYAIGAPFLIAFIVLGVFLVWHLHQGLKLARWLCSSEDGVEPPPGTGGPWRPIYSRVNKQLRRHSDRSAALAQQLDKYRQVARALPDAAVTFNRLGEIELINDAAGRLLGLHEPQDLGRPVKNLIRAPRFVEYLERGRFESPLEIASPADPEITLSISIMPYGDLDKSLLLARDTSRLHRLERMRQDFIANVSHEMKSPLTVIKGYVETLLDTPGNESRARPLSQIEQQTDRMCAIVEDLMALSNLETGPAPESLQPVDIPALIRSVMAEAKALSHGEHEIRSDIDEGLFILGNFNELYSAFSNVVFNAVRYTGQGGAIRVSWKRQADGRARYAVSDSGIGIAPEHIPRLTERFYRVDQARSRELGGTGLGLAIVKHVLMRHNARLDVDSEPGKGSTFSAVFPADRVQSRPSRDKQRKLSTSAA